MRAQTLGDKPAFVTDRYVNVAGATLPKGSIAVLALNGTQDGNGIFAPSDGNAAFDNALFLGVCLTDIADNTSGEVVRSGFCRYAKLTRQTRASSTDVWASEDTLGKGVHLTLDTVNDNFQTRASSGTQASSVAVSTSANFVHVVLAQTLAAYASSASATSDTRTAITAAVAVFLRDL